MIDWIVCFAFLTLSVYLLILIKLKKGKKSINGFASGVFFTIFIIKLSHLLAKIIGSINESI
ncbi:MAG: hypothetical protein P0S95_02550 [Rhabdochlamydiaceae bacterium]|nr:hypothetical protein [Candidatus Amphrikana amoebophyrae]